MVYAGTAAPVAVTSRASSGHSIDNGILVAGRIASSDLDISVGTNQCEGSWLVGNHAVVTRVHEEGGVTTGVGRAGTSESTTDEEAVVAVNFAADGLGALDVGSGNQRHRAPLRHPAGPCPAGQ